MVDLEGTRLTPDEKELLSRPEVGGVIFFSRNFAGREQFCDLVATVRQLRAELLLAVDQEGGRVQRLLQGYTRIPPMRLLGRYFSRDQALGSTLLRECGWLMASEVLASGLDFSFAPVLDLDYGCCEVIGDRSFGAEPELATRAIKAFLTGMHEAGMPATGKHFPGHGGVVADSHLETPVDERSLDELLDNDLVPFKQLAGELDAVMPAHILFPRFDDQTVCFSRRWLQDVLRGKLAFNGVIFSDDLSMKGADVAGSYSGKAQAALEAGCDMILVCNNRPGALEVADYLRDSKVVEAPYGRTPGLSSMKARHSPSWSDLIGDSRYRRALDLLQTTDLRSN